MNYHKRLVFDFDDTISFSKNRDWDNASPNIELIKKMNKLYDEGWQIDIFTARGSLSCSSREEAKNKFLQGMKVWLEKHSVKYHSVSFDKPLATFYIDDKALSPEEFINIEIKQLEGGLSGSDIYSDGKSVHKVDPNAHLVREWYENVSNINIPKIERIVGNVISMEYINNDPLYFKNNVYVSLGLIQDSLEKLRKIRCKDEQLFFSYLKRINDHIDASSSSVLQECRLYVDMIKDLDLKRSFSHGDFGITNMLFKDTKLYLIDPIPNVFGCTLLDAAKFICSLYINNYEKETIRKSFNALFSFCSCFYKISEKSFSYLIMCETIRIYKYHPNKSFIENKIKDILCF
jgi:capsule biosynthesis phosphatase